MADALVNLSEIEKRREEAPCAASNLVPPTMLDNRQGLVDGLLRAKSTLHARRKCVGP
jgi:hypothetical protein